MTTPEKGGEPVLSLRVLLLGLLRFHPYRKRFQAIEISIEPFAICEGNILSENENLFIFGNQFYTSAL
jgi:hypothetical protein